MYNCPKCDYGTNIPVEFRNHLKEQHPDIENPDLAYLHAGRKRKLLCETLCSSQGLSGCLCISSYLNMAACVTVSASRLIKKYTCSCPLDCESRSFPFYSIRSKYGEIISPQLLRANIPNAVGLLWVSELHILPDDKVFNIFNKCL